GGPGVEHAPMADALGAQPLHHGVAQPVGVQAQVAALPACARASVGGEMRVLLLAAVMPGARDVEP
ncbi:hypothetical protein HRF68_23620, partial [Pseudomonas stutzeri]|nr:hypothetical protein [Stutzerimonas stutzeri]